MTTRIQLRRTKGWRKPSNAVSVTRPGPFGNPFRVVRAGRWAWAVTDEIGCCDANSAGDKEWSEAIAVIRYRDWLGLPAQRDLRNRIRATFGPASGKVPACWCGEGQPCHADVILEIAATPREG